MLATRSFLTSAMLIASLSGAWLATMGAERMDRPASAEIAAVVPVSGAASASVPTDLDAWKAHLARLVRDSSWWWTSNAEHAAEDGIDAFGMRYRLVAGDLTSRGCLWGVRDQRTTGVAWYFYQGWDAGAGAPFFHQTAPSGATGMGTGWTIDGSTHEQEQVFRWPDGSTTRLAHRTTFAGPDTMITASRTWVDGRWVPQRTYTWIRRSGGGEGCNS
jgi:hypothetical protein